MLDVEYRYVCGSLSRISNGFLTYTVHSRDKNLVVNDELMVLPLDFD